MNIVVAHCANFSLWNSNVGCGNARAGADIRLQSWIKVNNAGGAIAATNYLLISLVYTDRCNPAPKAEACRLEA